MNTTLTISANLHCSPFDVFEQECDEVIMLINFYIKKAENGSKKAEISKQKPKKQDTFWDF